MASVDSGLNGMLKRLEKSIDQRMTFWIERLPVQNNLDVELQARVFSKVNA